MKRWLGIQLIAVSAIAILVTPNLATFLENRYGSSQAPGQTSVYFTNAGLATQTFSLGSDVRFIINNGQNVDQNYHWSAYLAGNSIASGDATIASKNIQEFVIPVLSTGKLVIKFQDRHLILQALIQ